MASSCRNGVFHLRSSRVLQSGQSFVVPLHLPLARDEHASAAQRRCPVNPSGPQVTKPRQAMHHPTFSSNAPTSREFMGVSDTKGQYAAWSGIKTGACGLKFSTTCAS